MAEPSAPEGTPVVGRSWADAAVDIAKLLGSLAPLAIVVAGALFAFYMFREQAERSERELQAAREQVIKQNETERQAASKALQDSYGELRQTYEQMGKLSEQQIVNVKKLLELHGEVATSTEAQREQLRKIEEAAVRQRKQTDEARAEAEKAQAEVQLAAARKEAAEREAGDLNRRVVTLRGEHTQLQERLKREQEKVVGRVGDISRLREQLDELAGLVLRAPSDEVQAREIQARAQAILLELREPAQVLQAYAASQDPDAVAALKRLVGLSATSLEESLRQGLGYEVWLKGFSESGELEVFIGVVRQREADDEGFLGLEVAGGHISNVFPADLTLVVAATDVNNWQRTKAYSYAIAAERVEWLGEDVAVDRGNPEWTYHLIAPSGARLEPVFGMERRHRFVSPEEFAQRHRRAYEQVKNEQSKGGLALRMEERALGFHAARAIANLDVVQPPPLREALVNLVNMTVRRDGTIRDFLPEGSASEWAGQLAALALRERFTVVSASTEEPRPVSPATQQSPAMGSGTAEPAARIVVEHQEPYGTTVRSVLRWSEVPGGRWVLAAIEPLPPAPPSPPAPPRPPVR